MARPKKKNQHHILKPSLLTLALMTAGMSAQLVFAQEQQAADAQVKEEAPITADELSENTQAAENAEQTDVAETEEGQVVVITGYRGSLVRSLDEKRAADTVTDRKSVV